MSDLVLKGSTLTLCRLQPHVRLRSAHWRALLLILVGIGLPECCLNGSHRFGSGMDIFGPICMARP